MKEFLNCNIMSIVEKGKIENYPSADTKNADYTCEVWIAIEKK